MPRKSNKPPENQPDPAEKVIFLPWAKTAEISEELMSRPNTDYFLAWRERGKWHVSRGKKTTDLELAFLLTSIAAELTGSYLKDLGRQKGA